MLMSKLHKVSLMSDGSQEIKMFLTSQLEDFDIVNQPFRNPIVRVRGRNKKKKKTFSRRNVEWHNQTYPK